MLEFEFDDEESKTPIIFEIETKSFDLNKKIIGNNFK